MAIPLMYRLSEVAITVAWERKIDRDTHSRVMELDRLIASSPFRGWVENVPAYHTLTVYYDPFITDFDVMDLLRRSIESMRNEADAVKGRLHKIPVRYDPALAPDLPCAAKFLGMEIDQLVRLHTSKTYRVYMIGFMPGFPYMGELPSLLEIPRKAEPTRMMAGTVAIAGRQTGIYPFDSPGGWYGIGKTTIPLFKDGKAYFEPGDEVQFIAE